MAARRPTARTSSAAMRTAAIVGWSLLSVAVVTGRVVAPHSLSSLETGLLEKHFSGPDVGLTAAMHEVTLSDAELATFVPLALSMLSAESKLEELVLRERQSDLSVEVVEWLVGVHEFLASGGLHRWCDTRPQLGDAGLTRAQLEQACESMPVDAPRGEPGGTPVQPDGTTTAVVVPVVISAFLPTAAPIGAPTREQLESLMVSVNELWAGMQWRTGFPGTRTPPKDGPRPDTRIRFALADVQYVDDAALAACPDGAATASASGAYDRTWGFARSDVLNLYVCDMGETAGAYARFGGSVFVNTRLVAALAGAEAAGGGSPSAQAHAARMSVAHALGHALGLHHTFQGGCGLQGDGVRDTPAMQLSRQGFTDCPELYELIVDEMMAMLPTLKERTLQSYVDAGWSRERAQREWRKSEPPQGWRPYYEAHMRTEQGAADDTCPDAAGLDAVYNIMSYSYCGVRFSAGQVARMHALALSDAAPWRALTNRASIFRPSEERRRWRLVGVGRCAERATVETRVAQLDECLAHGAAPQLDDGSPRLVSAAADGSCQVFAAPAADCLHPEALSDRPGRWLTYARRAESAPERNDAWVAESGSSASVELSARAIEPGTVLVARIRDDPFLSSADNWAAVYPAGASATTAEDVPVDGRVYSLGTLPTVAADEAGRRKTRELRLDAPPAHGVYAVRVHCCAGFAPLLGGQASQRATFLVSEDPTERQRFVEYIERGEDPAGWKGGHQGGLITALVFCVVALVCVLAGAVWTVLARHTGAGSGLSCCCEPDEAAGAEQY